MGTLLGELSQETVGHEKEEGVMKVSGRTWRPLER